VAIQFLSNLVPVSEGGRM